jgi:hypothetical protein
MGLIGKDILNRSVTPIILDSNTYALFYKKGANAGVYVVLVEVINQIWIWSIDFSDFMFSIPCIIIQFL